MDITHKTVKNVEGHTAKDFCTLWKLTYKAKCGKPFIINWVKDGNTFKKLMSVHNNLNIVKLIEFAFSDNSVTSFLRSTGYSISVFIKEVNKYQQIMDEDFVDETQLNLDLPYWDDERFSFLVGCVDRGDLTSLVDNLNFEEFNGIWMLLMKKVEKQDSSFLTKIKIYYKLWKNFVNVDRTSIQK